MSAPPPLIPPSNPRRIARNLRLFGRVVLVAALIVAGRMAWAEWRRTEPTMEELMPGSEAADARQIGIMDGLFARDVWNVWTDVSRPYPAAVLIAAGGVLVFVGCRRLARRHDADVR